MNTEITRLTEFDENLIRYLFDNANVPGSEPNPAFFDDEKNIMLVSTTDGETSGFLWAYVLASLDKSKSKMFLYSIDTFEPFKRLGIATSLIERLKEIARDYNCYKMFVPTNRNNIPAIALYRGTGGISLGENDDLTFTYDLEM